MMDGSIATVICSCLVGILSSSVVTALLQRRWSRKDRASAESRAVMYCLLVILQNEARRELEQGYVTKLEYNQFGDMYQCYKDLGGDGYADALKEQIDKEFEETLKGGIIV